MLISSGATGDQWSAKRYGDGVLVEGQAPLLAGRESEVRRGDARPVETRKLSKTALAKRQRDRRRQQREALADSPFRARSPRPGPNDPDRTAFSRSQTTPGTSTQYMRGLRQAVQVDDTWYRRNDLSEPEIPPRPKVVKGGRGGRRKAPKVVGQSTLVYRSESPK